LRIRLIGLVRKSLGDEAFPLLESGRRALRRASVLG
jgi:hypothetical protein